MSVAVRPISTEEHLAFLREQPSASFLQTPAWARVKTEWRAESLGLFQGDDDRPTGVALVLHRPVPRLRKASLAYLPEGPVLAAGGTLSWQADLDAWLEPLTAYLKRNGAFGVRMGPPVVTATWTADQVKDGIASDEVRRLSDLAPASRSAEGARVVSQLRAAGWRLQSPEDGFGVGQPQYTFEIPLADDSGAARTEADVLAGMNQLWRRNIKRADKEGVVVTVSSGVGDEEADLAAFHALYVHTAKRDHFTPRPLGYFRTMFAAMSAESGPEEQGQRIRLFLAHHDGELAAATIMVRVGGHAWYSYGASSTEKRDVRGSNALQWAMLRTALAEGCTVYDLRGITPTLAADDSHVGLIQFKVGTGGHAVEYAGEWDLPLNPLLYRAFDTYLKLRSR